MKPALVLASLLAFAFPATAIAGSIALSVGGCPGNVGALGGDATRVPEDCGHNPFCSGTDYSNFTGPRAIDCSTGDPIVILATWTPNEDIPDLSNLDGSLKIETDGDLTQSTFWNFDPVGCNVTALSSSQLRPASGCDAPDYLDAWNAPGSGSAVGGALSSPTKEKLSFTCYRPTPLSVTAGQKLFGIQIIVDVSKSADRGGTCSSCCTAGNLGIGWEVARPGSLGSSVPTNISWANGFSLAPGFTDAVGLFSTAAACAAVPTTRHTWGQLKSLYR